MHTLEADPGNQAVLIAAEVARILRGSGFLERPPAAERQDWLDAKDAARMLGYSASRFYHIYARLGLVPSRTSQRKLRFRRQDLEKLQIRCQTRGPGRPRKRRAMLILTKSPGVAILQK